MRCSLHGHEFKWNLFLIMSGELTIEVKQKAYKLIDRTVLGPGAFTTVRPGLVHRFITGAKPVEAFEIYYPQWLEGEDIIRQDVGGVIRKRGRA